MLRLALEAGFASCFVDAFLLEVLLERSAVLADGVHSADSVDQVGVVLVEKVHRARDLRLRGSDCARPRREKERTLPSLKSFLISLLLSSLPAPSVCPSRG